MAIARFADRLVVSTPTSARTLAERYCTLPSFATRLSFFDVDGFDLIRTSTLPHCLIGLAGVPGEDHFYGMGQERLEAFLLYVFDRDGRVIQRVEVPVRGQGLAATGFALGEAGLGTVLGRWQTASPVQQSLHVFEPGSLVERAEIELGTTLPSEGTGGLFPAGHGFISLDDPADKVRWVRSAAAGEVEEAQPGPPGVAYTAALWDPSHASALVAVSGGILPMFSVRIGHYFAQRLVPGHPAVGTGITEMPGVPGRALLAWSAEIAADSPEAFLSTVELRDAKIIPSQLDLGPGIATKLVVDPERRQVFMLLPWSGEVVRVRQR
jgi:hypothetical protein